MKHSLVIYLFGSVPSSRHRRKESVRLLKSWDYYKVQCSRKDGYLDAVDYIFGSRNVSSVRDK